MRERNRWTLWNGTSLERRQQFTRQPVTSLDSSDSSCQQTTEETWTVQEIQWGHSSRPGKRLHCKSTFPSTERYRMVHTTLWSCQPKQTRQDTKNMQCQSSTKRTSLWQTLSWTWPPREFCYDSDREPLPSRETSKRCLWKSEYDNRTDVIYDSCGDNPKAQN